MRRKHHYTIKKLIYNYKGDYFSLDEKPTITEVIMFQTNKREKADSFYAYASSQEYGTIYKDIYYPLIDIVFQKDY